MAVQFSIYDDSSRPENVIERWAFTFQYYEDPKGTGRRLLSISSQDSDSDERITVGNARSSLTKIIDAMIVRNGMLPELPGIRNSCSPCGCD